MEATLAPAAPAQDSWLLRLFDRFWGTFQVRRAYSLGVEYRPLADKADIKLAVNVEYLKYFWDRSIGTHPVTAATEWGAMGMGGDPLAVAIVTCVKGMQGRFLKREMPALQKELERRLKLAVAWLDVKILKVEAYQYGAAAVEQKKK